MGVYRGVALDNVRINSGTAALQSMSVTGAISAGSVAGNAPSTLKTANFSVGDTETYIICNGAGSLTATLPAAASWSGRSIYIKTIAAQTVVSASSNVKPIGSNTAGTAILAASAGAWALLVSDGTNWVVMAS
jgi:hypothetical protein